MVTSKYMLKYIHSRKGIATKKRYLEKNHDEVRAYHRAYAKKRRLECKEKGLCIKCFGKKVEKGVFCMECYTAMKIAIERYREKKYGKKKVKEEKE